MYRKSFLSKTFIAFILILTIIFFIRIIIIQSYLFHNVEQSRKNKNYESAMAYIDAAIQNIPFDSNALALQKTIAMEHQVAVSLERKLEDEKLRQIEALQAEIEAFKLSLNNRKVHFPSDLNLINYLQTQLAIANQKILDSEQLQNILRFNLTTYEKTIADLQGQLNAAKREIEAADKTKSDLTSSLTYATSSIVELKEQLGKAQKRIKELSAMIDALNEGNSLTQDNRYQVSYLVENAEDRIAKNDNQGAKRLLDEALSAEPMNPRANMVLASLLMKENSSSKETLNRIEFLLKRIALSTGETAEILQLRGGLCEARLQFAGAEEAYSEALKKSGYNDKIVSSLIRVLEKQQKWKEILDVSTPYREEKVERLFIYQSRAMAYLYLENIPECINELLIAHQLKPSNINVMALLSKAYITVKEFEKAVSILKELIAKDSDYRNWQQLANCYDNLNQIENAFKAYERAINNNPLTSKDEVLSQISMCLAASKNRMLANDKNGTLYYYKKGVDYSINTDELKKWGEYLGKLEIK